MNDLFDQSFSFLPSKRKICYLHERINEQHFKVGIIFVKKTEIFMFTWINLKMVGATVQFIEDKSLSDSLTRLSIRVFRL